MKVTRVCPQAKARSQGVAGENSVTVSQYTPETFPNAREKSAQGMVVASQRTRISTWSLRFLAPFWNNPLADDDTWCASWFAREGARITQGCVLVRVPAREREEGETYIWQIQRAPSCPSFLPAGTDTYGPGPRWVLLFSFLPACLSVCLLCLTVWLYHLTPSSSTELFSDVFCPPTSPNGSNHLPPSNLFPRTRSYFFSFLSFIFFVRNTWLRILEDIGTAFVRRKDSSSYGIRFLCFGQPPLHQWLFIILK